MNRRSNSRGKVSMSRLHWARAGAALAALGLVASLSGCQAVGNTVEKLKGAALVQQVKRPVAALLREGKASAEARATSTQPDAAPELIELPTLYVVGRVPHARVTSRNWDEVGSMYGLPVLAPPLGAPEQAEDLSADLSGVAGDTPKAERALAEAPLPRLPATTAPGDPLLSPAAVDAVFATERGAVRMCYRSALLFDPSLRGRLEVKLSVGHDGRVQRLHVSAPALRGTGVIPCVARAFAGAQFAHPAVDVVSVSYPYQLSPARS
jgi:hypothetical protein